MGGSVPSDPAGCYPPHDNPPCASPNERTRRCCEVRARPEDRQHSGPVALRMADVKTAAMVPRRTRLLPPR